MRASSMLPTAAYTNQTTRETTDFHITEIQTELVLATKLSMQLWIGSSKMTKSGNRSQLCTQTSSTATRPRRIRDLRIYKLAMSHYFNVNNGNTWCDNVAFHPGSDALLTLALRKEFNELVERANGVIQQVVSTFAEHHVGYVSITEGFGGHRFCEPDSNRVAQFISSNVWNWNIQPSFFPSDWKTNDGGTNNPISFPEPAVPVPMIPRRLLAKGGVEATLPSEEARLQLY